MTYNKYDSGNDLHIPSPSHHHVAPKTKASAPRVVGLREITHSLKSD